MVKLKVYFVGFCALMFVANATAQNGLLDNITLQQPLRDQSLLDTNQQKTSYTIRYGANLSNNSFSNKATFRFNGLTSTFQSNSILGWGINDGSMHPSVGQQIAYSPAAFFTWKRFSASIQPEFVYADNKPWDGLPNDWDGTTPGWNDQYWARFYASVANVIETPYRPYQTSTHKVYWGQSNINYNFNKFSLGISNENIWWGPGLYHSLTMTNNAPGFLHAGFQTKQPVQTPIGTVEGQFLIGNLQNADTPPSENENIFAVNNYIQKPRRDRYITGMVLSLQPKYVPNFFIGFSTSAYGYKKDGSGFFDYTPFNNWSSKADAKKRPAMGAVFFRYVMPKDHAEIYVEYGRKDRAATFTNIFQDSIPTGFVAGFKKLFPLGIKGNKGAIALALESVHLKLQNPNLLFLKTLGTSTPSWYTSAFVPQGYTNRGQVIGSGIGPGSTSQLIHLGWVKGYKRIGASLERVAHNKDFYYYNYFNGLISEGPNYKYWADFIYGLNARWDWRNLIFATEVRSTKSYNYKWSKTGLGGIYGPSDTDRANLQFVFSVKYQNFKFKRGK